MKEVSYILTLLVIFVLSASGSASTSSKITVQGAIIRNGENIVRGVEGNDLNIVCNIVSGIPKIKSFMNIHGLQFTRVGNGSLAYHFKPSKKDNRKSFVCSADSPLLDKPLSSRVLLDIQYAPLVKISKKVTRKIPKLICNPRGNPDSYTFDDWEHWSEFKQHIRNVNGTPDGQLTFLKSNNNNNLHENDGIYKCKTSNGVYGINGRLYQKGSVLLNNKASAIFVNGNNPIQYGRYGEKTNLKVYLYNTYGTIQTTISKRNEILNIHGRQEKVLTQDIFHDINVTVSGIKITFLLTLGRKDDFTDYTITACNNKGCNVFTVKVTSNCRPESPQFVSVIPYARYLEVMWDPGFDGGYHQTFFVEYRQESENTWKRSGPVVDNRQVRLSKTLNNLNPKTRYQVRVFSKNEIGDSNQTAVTSVMTLAERPESPTNVSVIPYDRHLEVSWCPEFNGGDPQTFFIEYQKVVGEKWTRAGPIIHNMQTRMSNLLYNMTPNTQYLVRMFSRNVIGESNQTTVVAAMTLGRPESPQFVSVIAYARYLEVVWVPGFDGAYQQTFFVEYRQESENTWKRTGPVVDNRQVRLSKILNNLNPKTRYQVRVLSKNEIGDSNQTAVTSVMTVAERPESPTNVSVIPYDRHLKVSWCPEFNGGDPQTFFIEYQQVTGEKWTRAGPIIDNMQTRMSNFLYNMTPNTQYLVRMFSRNEIGESNQTTVVAAMTLEEDASDNYSPVEEEVRENFQEITGDDYRRTTFQENDNAVISMVNIVGVGNPDTVSQFSEHASASSDDNTNTVENYDDGYEKPSTTLVVQNRTDDENGIIPPTHVLTTEASNIESAHYTEIAEDDYRQTIQQENDNPIIAMVNNVDVGNGDTVSLFSEHASASSDDHTNTLENYDDGYEKPYTTLVVQNRADDENGIMTQTHVLTTEASSIESVHYTDINEDDYRQPILQENENSIISTVNVIGVDIIDIAAQSSKPSSGSSDNNINTLESYDDGYEKPYTTLMVQHRADDEHVYRNTNTFYENSTPFEKASRVSSFEFTKQDTSQIATYHNDYTNGDEENANRSYIDNDFDKNDKDCNQSHIDPPEYKAEYINLMLK